MPFIAEQFGLGLGLLVILVDATGNIRKIARFLRWNDNGFRRRCFAGGSGSFRFERDACLFLDGCDDGMIEGCDAVIVELRSDGAKYRHFLR